MTRHGVPRLKPPLVGDAPASCHAPAAEASDGRPPPPTLWQPILSSPRLLLRPFAENEISIRLCDEVIESAVFRALADPTRRAIFEKLTAGSMNASALREGMAISQPAMSQHLAVLRNARLVREERQGRFVNVEVDPDGLALVARWLARYRAYWPARIAALEVLLKDMDQ